MRLLDVHVRYASRARWVLRGIDAELGPGDVVLVSGRNGAGKSTLLRVLAGLLRPAPGAVQDRPEVVGWLPERLPIRQAFTVDGYLRSMAAVQGLARAESRPRIDALVERLFLGPFLHTPLASVSQGTGRKVGLTAALLRSPGLLVLDEPWEGLDPESQQEIPVIVSEVTSAGGICVLTDHLGHVDTLAGPLRRWRVEDGGVHEPAAGHEVRGLRSEA